MIHLIHNSSSPARGGADPDGSNDDSNSVRAVIHNLSPGPDDHFGLLQPAITESFPRPRNGDADSESFITSAWAAAKAGTVLAI